VTWTVWEEWPTTRTGYQLRSGDYIWGSYIQTTPSNLLWSATFCWLQPEEEPFHERQLLRSEAGARLWVSARYLLASGARALGESLKFTCFKDQAPDCSCVACTAYCDVVQDLAVLGTSVAWESKLLQSEARRA
jgi:hypothetical protein